MSWRHEGYTTFAPLCASSDRLGRTEIIDPSAHVQRGERHCLGQVPGEVEELEAAFGRVRHYDVGAALAFADAEVCLAAAHVAGDAGIEGGGDDPSGGRDPLVQEYK